MLKKLFLGLFITTGIIFFLTPIASAQRGTTTTTTVPLTQTTCTNRSCPAGTVCSNGQCISTSLPSPILATQIPVPTIPQYTGPTPTLGPECRYEHVVCAACVDGGNCPPCIPFIVICPTSTPTATPTCIPEPACRHLIPACTMPEPAGGWCPPSTPPPTPPVTPDACQKHSQGDANCDGKIDLLDFNMWRDIFLKYGSGKPTNFLYLDFNDDKSIDLLDFNIWRTYFLQDNPQATPAPTCQPGTAECAAPPSNCHYTGDPTFCTCGQLVCTTPPPIPTSPPPLSCTECLNQGGNVFCSALPGVRPTATCSTIPNNIGALLAVGCTRCGIAPTVQPTPIPLNRNTTPTSTSARR